MSGTAVRSFVIRVADESRIEAILEFHKENLTKHLWPRTIKEFQSLAEQENLYEAIETSGGGEELVGICYIMPGQEIKPPYAERDEFGGVYVADNCRSCGIGTALGKTSLANHFAWDPPKGRLIAHVHEENPLPRGMLVDRLGFLHKVEENEIPPAEVVKVAAPSMKRNEEGQVVGHLFELQHAALQKLADWVEGFAGTIKGKSGESRLQIALPSMTRYRSNTIKALREHRKR
ncbi:MAG: hypothetical protein AAB320_01295 [Elusimicrobiota bacterium]